MKRKILLMATLLLAIPGCSITFPSKNPKGEFKFNSPQLTIDMSKQTEGTQSIINTYDDNDKIEWIIPSSNIIIFDKIETISKEENSYHVFNVGSITIQAKWKGKTIECHIDVINSIEKKTNGTESITIYAVNDYHGHVNENFSLKHFGTFIKEKTQEENTLFLDQGDTWQGSLESNYNRGHLITDVYNAAGMSARTVGNHDFDWGIEKLESNVNASYHGYSTPTLAANVYDFDWDNKVVGNTQQSNIGREYVTYTLESGLKVGIVGTISDSCESDISTANIMSIDFINMVEVIKKVSDTLKTKEKCDIVIASMHEGYSANASTLNPLTEVSSVSGKRYIDLCLNGHTHDDESKTYNGVTFAQFGNYGSNIGEINLKYDYESHEITSTEVNSLSTSSLVDDYSNFDPEIAKIVDQYNEETEAIGKEVLTDKLDGKLTKKEGVPNLICKAMYEEAKKEGFDVSYAVCNKGREPIEGPEVTYSELYEAIPFDNVCFVIELSGKDAYRELTSENDETICIYRGDNDEARSPLDSNKEKYTFVIIDFLALHSSANRQYDLIPSVKPIDRLKKNGETYYYRELTADYLRNQERISKEDYSSSNIRFDRSKVTSELTIS